jgi:hypothetical protein
MRSTLMVLMMALTVSFVAKAGELDNEKAVTNQQVSLAKDLPATLVMRVNATTKAVEVLHLKDKLPADSSAQSLVLAHTNEFQAADLNAKVTGELDQDSSRSSWYFYYPTYNWYYPTYYYSGYNYYYQPYYNYYYGGYNYYYCGWRY